jgi:hypothetical protein
MAMCPLLGAGHKIGHKESELKAQIMSDLGGFEETERTCHFDRFMPSEQDFAYLKKKFALGVSYP